MRNLLNEHLLKATIVGIHWERITVFFDVKLDYLNDADRSSHLEFYAVNGLNSAKAILQQDSIGDGMCRLSVNVTNPGDVRCLPVGTYKIIVCRDDDIIAYCAADPSLTPEMENLSRHFLYKNRSAVYAVTFLVEEGEEDLPFVMHTLSASRTKMAFPSDKRKKKKMLTFSQYKKKNSRRILRKMYRRLRSLHNASSPSKQTILFMTEQSDSLGANLTAVYDRMKERGLDSRYELLTSARMASSKGQGQRSWIELMKKLAKSDMVFVDDHAPVFDWLKLDKRTKLVQLWHAGAGFKSSGYSRWGHIGCPAPVSAHRQYAYGIAGSKNIAHFFSEVWGINTENVLPTGMPRIDEYLNADYRAKVTEQLYQLYPECQGRKVILFAPTYRGKNRKEAYYPFELIDFDRLYELCVEKDYIVMFKMHPWVSESVPIRPEHADRFIDVGHYPNINDLFYITELLITDYSSNIFEFSLMRKPMLFFAFDEIQYSFSRGFHRDYESSAPGKVCHTFGELVDAIENECFDYEKVDQYVEHHFDYVDTHASDRVIDWIVLGEMPEEIAERIENRKMKIEKMKSLDFSVLDDLPNEEEEEDGVLDVEFDQVVDDHTPSETDSSFDVAEEKK